MAGLGVVIKSIQTGTITIGAGVASNTATLASSVNMNKAFIVPGGSTFSSNTGDYSSMFADVVLTNSTTVTAARSGNTFIVVVPFTVVEFY